MATSLPKRVYTFGVFDLLHVGHIRIFQRAKMLGDELIVGVFTDDIAESFKRKPIIPFGDRVEMIKAIKYVDKVIPQDSYSPEENLKAFKVDIVCKASGAGWEKDNYPKFPGIKSVFLPYREGVSTTNIIKRCYDSFKPSTGKD